jgi:hypothetical protein
MSSPNLFSFATSELSQDAFICWLLSWAAPEHASADRALNSIACALLDRLLELGKVNKPEKYERIEVKKQVHHMDVLVEINGRLAIIIEDKTFTRHHSAQLERYLANVSGQLGRENVAAIYFKTGDQSSYAEVEAAGYAPFRRADLLNVLEQGRKLGVANRIFLDFEDYLRSLEDAIGGFKAKPFEQWDWHCWTGFFIELQKRLGDGDWDYVPNPSGGFVGFWWHWRENKYLQLEEEKLCFKIQVDDNTLRATAWEEWHNALVTAAGFSQLPLQRPARRGSGTWMTVARADGEYRRTKLDGTLDIEGTLEVLRKAEALLDSAIP